MWNKPSAERLRSAIAQLEPAAALPASSEFQQYCRYYSLDLEPIEASVSHRLVAVRSGQFQLATQVWQIPGASHNLLLVHGLFDHTGLFAKLIAFGLEMGCNVVVFDWPGHGLSSDEAASIESFTDYGDAIAAVLEAVDTPTLPWLAMAQSMGCAALVEFARCHPWPFDKAVLLAPLVRPAQWRLVSGAYVLLHRLVKSVPRGFAKNSSDLEFLQFIRADPMQSHLTSLRWVGALRHWLKSLPNKDLGVGPLLIVQGDADQTVDWRYNIPVLSTLFPTSDCFYLPKAGHQLANESAELRDQYLLRVRQFFNI